MEELLTNILTAVSQQGIWCMLFIWMFVNTQKKSDLREEKLNAMIDNQTAKLGEITNTLDKINNRIEIIENKIEE